MSNQESEDSTTVAKVLWITVSSGQTLLSSDALSDFDAVVVDQVVGVWGLPPEAAPPPGFQRDLDPNLFESVRLRLRRRTQEAADLLAHGGVLIVRLFPLSGLTTTHGNPWLGQPRQERTSSADWWLGLDQRWSWMNTNLPETPAVISTSGTVAHVNDPGHLLEGYLRASRYQATLSRTFIEGSGARVLATNRGGEVLAIEMPITAGLLLILPADGSEIVLADGLSKLLDLRNSLTSEWPLSNEVTAFALLEEAERELHASRLQAQESIFAVQERKRRIMQDPAVVRVTDFYRSALSPGTSRQTALAKLYSAIELIQKSLGGAGQMLAVLSIAKGTVDKVKQPANDPTGEARHVAPGATAEIDDAVIREATAAAREIVLSYLEWLFRQDGTANE